MPKLPRRKTARLASLVLATLLLCSGCDDRGAKVGETAAAISGSDIHGNAVSLERLKNRVVVIYFWASSCCGSSIKELEPLYRRYQEKGLEILAINADSRTNLRHFASDNSLTFTILPDQGGALSSRYQVLGFPTLFILDRNGVLREKVQGGITAPRLEALIRRQLDIQEMVDRSYQRLHAR